MRWLAALSAVAVLTACSGSDAGVGTQGGGDSGAADGGGSDGSSGADQSSEAAGGDASVQDGAAGGEGGEGGANACTVDGGFPTFVKGCTNTQSCIVKLHQVDCCGTKIAVGVNHDQYTVFDQAEAAWEAQCPACNCPPGPTTAEDGKSGMSSSVQVQCTAFDAGVGVCMTFFQ